MTQKRVFPIDGSTVSHHAIITLAIRLSCSAVASLSRCQASLGGCSKLRRSIVSSLGHDRPSRLFRIVLEHPLSLRHPFSQALGQKATCAAAETKSAQPPRTDVTGGEPTSIAIEFFPLFWLRPVRPLNGIRRRSRQDRTLARCCRNHRSRTCPLQYGRRLPSRALQPVRNPRRRSR
jgi:hypothetical protein